MFSSISRYGRAVPSVRGRLAALLLLALPTVAVPAAAQQGAVVQGTVVAAEGGAPLAAVSVTIPGTGLGVLSDAQGRYRIAGVPAGRMELVARRLGYESGAQSVDLVAGGVSVVDFRLAQQAVLLPAVVVSATREAQRLSETAATVGVVSSEALREAKPTHPAEVMGQIPGVWMSVTGGEGHMTAIRQPRTTNPVYLFLEDGVPTRSTGFFNHNALYEVNVPQAERIEVLKGPATALYGSDAIGGVINVETRRPSLTPAAEWFAEGGASGYGRLLLSGSNTWGGNGVRADLNLTRTDGWRDGTAYNRQSGTLRWDHYFAGGTTARTVLTASRIEQQTAGSSALLRDDYLNAPTVNYAPISLRHVQAARLSTAIEKEAGRHAPQRDAVPALERDGAAPELVADLRPDDLHDRAHARPACWPRSATTFEPLRSRVIAGVDVDYSPGTGWSTGSRRRAAGRSSRATPWARRSTTTTSPSARSRPTCRSRRARSSACT
jgi:outer membrane receptor protein involved in Fe transport